MFPEIDRDYFFAILAYMKPGFITRLIKANLDRKMSGGNQVLMNIEPGQAQPLLINGGMSNFINGYKKSKKGAQLINRFFNPQPAANRNAIRDEREASVQSEKSRSYFTYLGRRENYEIANIIVRNFARMQTLIQDLKLERILT